MKTVRWFISFTGGRYWAKKKSEKFVLLCVKHQADIGHAIVTWPWELASFVPCVHGLCSLARYSCFWPAIHNIWPINMDNLHPYCHHLTTVCFGIQINTQSCLYIFIGHTQNQVFCTEKKVRIIISFGSFFKRYYLQKSIHPGNMCVLISAAADFAQLRLIRCFILDVKNSRKALAVPVQINTNDWDRLIPRLVILVFLTNLASSHFFL